MTPDEGLQKMEEIGKKLEQDTLRELKMLGLKLVLMFTATIALGIACMVFVVLIYIKQGGMQLSMSYGVHEQSQYWNRIRVDEGGHVICSGKEK